MSALGNQVFANDTTPIWLSASTPLPPGPTGPTGPTGPSGPPGPPGPSTFAGAYGSFCSLIEQDFNKDEVWTFEHDTTNIPPVGMSISTPFLGITVSKSGVYKVQTSALFECFTPAVVHTTMWIEIDGVPVPNSAAQVRLTEFQTDTLTFEWIVAVGAGQSISIKALPNDIGLRVITFPATVNAPAIPSITTTVIEIA